MENDKVYRELEKQILSLQLRPGEELSLSAMENLFGVSRSPVRDAVHELSLKGLADIYPQKGTFVSRINLSRAEDERFIRLQLELGTLERFMECKTDKDITVLEQLIEEQERAFSVRDTRKLLDLDDQFHKVFFDVSGRSYVFELIANQSGNYHRMRVISFMFDSIAGDVIDQHRQLVQAIKDNNITTLADLDRSHISKLVRETDSFRASMPQYFI